MAMYKTDANKKLVKIAGNSINSNSFFHVNKQITGFTNSSETPTKTNIDLTDILPNDGNNYMLLVSFNAWGQGGINKTPQAYLYSSIISEGVRLAGGRNYTAEDDQIVGSAVIPIASDRYLSLDVLRVSSSRFIIHGYWRC